MPAKRFFFVLILFLALGAPSRAAAFSPSPAQPESATFYPNEVQVAVSEELTPEALPWGGRGLVLTLPATAAPDGFLLNLDGAPAGGWFWLNAEQREALLAANGKDPSAYKALLPENEIDPKRKVLLQNLRDLALEKARLEGENAALEARLGLLRQSLAGYGQTLATKEGEKPLSRADEAAKLDEAYARLYPAIYLESERQRNNLAEIRQRHAEVQKKLARYDRREGVNFLAVPVTGDGKHKLQYSYLLPARAELSYRLDALPDKGEVKIGQDAALTQHSGFAWENVELRVSTIRRDNNLTPGKIRPWGVVMVDRPRPGASSLAKAPSPQASGNAFVQYADTLDTSGKDMPPAQEADGYNARQRVRGQADFGGQEQPGEVMTLDQGTPDWGAREFATFRLWSLGRQRIDHDSPLRLALEETSVKAEFLYTLRPSMNPKGFLTARLDLKKALELPPGMAQMNVDGATMGRRRFSFNGRKGDIYFGSDPRVTAIMSDLQRSGGEQGLFSKDQTKVLHWEITVSNARQRPVRVLVEDPAPDAHDTGISIKNTSSPKPEAVVLDPEQGGAKIWRWVFHLEPGNAVSIDHKVEISAPASSDKELQSHRDGLAGQ